MDLMLRKLTVLYCATLALIYWAIDVGAKQIPTPAPERPATISSSTRMPDIDWGALSELFVISNAKMARQKLMTPGYVQYEAFVLTFLVEVSPAGGVYMPMFFGHCYDADNVETYSSMLEFSPPLINAQKGSRFRAGVRLPTDLSYCNTLRFISIGG